MFRPVPPQVAGRQSSARPRLLSPLFLSENGLCSPRRLACGNTGVGASQQMLCNLRVTSPRIQPPTGPGDSFVPTSGRPWGLGPRPVLVSDEISVPPLTPRREGRSHPLCDSVAHVLCDKGPLARVRLLV